jgi:UDP-glucose 4-epimerase
LTGVRVRSLSTTVVRIVTRTVLIGCGFIGARVVGEISRAGKQLLVVTRTAPAHDVALLPGVDVLLGDVADPTVAEEAIEGADQVVYAAGGLMPADSEANLALDVQLTLPPLCTVLEATRARPGLQFTLISSGGTVYGRPRYLPVDEDHPTEPVSSYGTAKLACEEYVGLYVRLHGLRACVLRCANVYGEGQPTDRRQGAVGTFLRRALHDEPVVVFGDGSTVRDYVYVGDVAAVVRALLEQTPDVSVLNVGSGRGTSLDELIRLVEVTTGKHIEVDRRPPRDFDVHEIVLDARRLRALIDLEHTPLEEGVRRTFEAMAGELSRTSTGESLG